MKTLYLPILLCVACGSINIPASAVATDTSTATATAASTDTTSVAPSDPTTERVAPEAASADQPILWYVVHYGPVGANAWYGATKDKAEAEAWCAGLQERGLHTETDIEAQRLVLPL